MIQIQSESFRAMKAIIPELLTMESSEVDRGIDKLILTFDGYDVENYANKAVELLKSYDLDVVRWVPMGKTGDFRGNYKFRIAILVNVPIPPDPPTQMPPRMKVPERVSEKAMELLRLIQSGADVRVRWRYRVPTLTVDDKYRDDLETVYHNELTETGVAVSYVFGQSVEFNVAQHILTNHEETENDEDAGIECKITLSDEGRAFLAAHPPAASDAEGTANDG